jgi:hypothetical protein
MMTAPVEIDTEVTLISGDNTELPVQRTIQVPKGQTHADFTQFAAETGSSSPTIAVIGLHRGFLALSTAAMEVEVLGLA